MADIHRIGLDEVARHFEELEDPRSTINRRHPLISEVVIALRAVLAGASGPTAIDSDASAAEPAGARIVERSEVDWHGGVRVSSQWERDG